MDVWWFPPIFHRVIWNLPIETSIFKWMFRVPGKYQSGVGCCNYVFLGGKWWVFRYYLSLPQGILTHTIHVWCIYLHLVDFYGKCRAIYHTWILWVIVCFSFLGGAGKKYRNRHSILSSPIYNMEPLWRCTSPLRTGVWQATTKKETQQLKIIRTTTWQFFLTFLRGESRPPTRGWKGHGLNHLVTAKKIQSQNFDFKTSSDPTAPGLSLFLLFGHL